MSKIKEFNKAECGKLGKAVEAELVKVGKRFGIDIQFRGGTFSGSEFTFRVRATTLDTNGAVKDKKAENFKKLASLYGMNPNDLGRTFTSGYSKYEIVGLNPSAHKYPIIVRDVKTNKRFKLSSDTVKICIKADGN